MTTSAQPTCAVFGKLLLTGFGLPLACALFLTVQPAAADTVYTNGPINGTTDAWPLNFGFVTSDTFTVGGGGATITGLNFGAWVLDGDVIYSVEAAITSSEFGGATYTDQLVNLTQSACSLNQYGFNVCTESGTFGTAVNLGAGTYWLTLENAQNAQFDDPVYWDENSGPSQASQNSVGTIPSEAFTILGSNGTTTSGTVPEPSSVILLGSGILGLAGLQRRKLF